MTLNAPKRKKKCATCAPLMEAVSPAKAAPRVLVAKKAAAAPIRRIPPKCLRNSTKIRMASSAKTNSWKWRKLSTSTCAAPMAREVQAVPDTKVTGHTDLPETHSWTRTAGQVHLWAGVLKAADLKDTVSPV